MLKLLVKKQLSEIFRSYFYDAKKNKKRSTGATILFFVLFALLMVVLLGGMFTLLSLALCGWTVVGTREGTVIAALCTGWLVKQVRPRLHPLCDRLLRPAPEENSPSMT